MKWYGTKVIAGVEFSSQQMTNAGSFRLTDGSRVKVIRSIGEGENNHLGKFGTIKGSCRLSKFKVQLDDGPIVNFDTGDLEAVPK